MHARKNRQGWQGIIRAFERSGETHEAFCAARDLNVGTFRAWLYRLRRDASEGVQLVAVDVAPREATVASMEWGRPIVVCVAGVELQVAPGTDAAYVARLVGELRRC